MDATQHTSPGHGSHHAHPTPVARLSQLLRSERGDIATLITYTVVAGLLALAVPLTAQALVNTIAANTMTQPLVVLSFLVFLSLALSGVLQLLKISLVERLQQRVFARTALQLASHLPRIRHSALHGEYAPELVNRFFDVLTVQKALSKLLLDGFAAMLQAAVGLALLGVYSPVLLGLDLFIILFMLFVVFVLGIGGLRTSIDESREKYRVADWLEDLARCQTSLKMHGALPYMVGRADRAVVRYLASRGDHFKVTFRQAAGNYVFQAVASTAVLAVGGWLVINRQLTLGQLVAAQIIVVSILAALEKLVRQSDQVFDLLTGLDKIGHVTDLPLERVGGRAVPTDNGGASITCRNVRFSYKTGNAILTGLNFSLAPGERVSLVGASGAGKSTLASLLCGLEEPSQGAIEINGVEVRAADLAELRQVVSMVGFSAEVFDGTVEENIIAGRDYLDHEDVRWAMEIAQLTEDVSLMAGGVTAQLVSGGENISRGQLQRLLIARAIIGRPSLLILDEAFTGIDERTAMKILDAIFSPEHPWTIVNISHDAEVVLRTNRVHVLGDGRILEGGEPHELAFRKNGEFAALFPSLCARLRATADAERARDALASLDETSKQTVAPPSRRPRRAAVFIPLVKAPSSPSKQPSADIAAATLTSLE